MQKADRGHTRWRQSLMLFIPALLGVGALTVMTIQGVLPLNLALSGQDFKLASNGAAVATQGLSAYPSTIEMKDGSHAPILMAAIPEAELADGICISLVLTFPLIGTNTLQINTDGEATVKDLQAAAELMAIKGVALNAATSDGNAPAKDGSNVKDPVAINKDASELDGISGGTPGSIGIDAPGVVRMAQLQATAKGATISGTAKLNGIGIPKIGRGRGTEHGECY
jgi:hypothetical protein